MTVSNSQPSRVTSEKSTSSTISVTAAKEEAAGSGTETLSEKKEVIDLAYQEEKDVREKIIIVDDIQEASEYRDSREILKEIKKFSEIDIEFAYQLA